MKNHYWLYLFLVMALAAIVSNLITLKIAATVAQDQLADNPALNTLGVVGSLLKK